MPELSVDVRDLTKTYRVPVREAGMAAAIKSLVNRKTRDVEAVKNISFEVEPGEIVGFLGPNGAGKTTTLKMLSGLLYPTSGEAFVLGHVPSKRPRELLRQITLVMGQRNQLMWDIPVIDSFLRNQAIYGLSDNQYKAALGELTELLALQDLLNKPVRNLSLGERMKCEVAAALLHGPRVLFLDEPTLGLDVTSQRRLREFIDIYNKQYGATVLLTSHYMADVEALCKRVIVIHMGQLLYDGQLSGLIAKFSAHKTISVDVGEDGADLTRYGEVISQEGGRIMLRVSKQDTPRITAEILQNLKINDLSVEDPPIEEVIDRVFSEAGS